MSRTIWSIVIVGFLTVIILVMSMLLMLKQYGDSTYSSSTKHALAIRNKFAFESVGTGTRDDGARCFLLIQYETHADSKFDLSAQMREMQKVAEFAVEKLDPAERKRFDEIRVRRTEIHGRGCFQQSFVANHSLPNPHRLPSRPP